MFCKKIADRHLWSLVTFLLEGLVDYQAHSSSGACVVLNNIVKLRGGTLSEQVTNWVMGECKKSSENKYFTVCVCVYIVNIDSINIYCTVNIIIH